MATSVPKRPPASLTGRGRALWRQIQQAYEFDGLDEALLLELCQAVDLADRLRKAVDAGPLMVLGSQGQERVTPLVAALQAQEALVDRLAGSLRVAMPTNTAGRRGQQVKAARTRWTRAGKPGPATPISIVGGP